MFKCAPGCLLLTVYDCVYMQSGIWSSIDQCTSETDSLLSNVNTGLVDVYVLGLHSARSTVMLNNTLPLTTSWDRTTQVLGPHIAMHFVKNYNIVPCKSYH